MAYVLKDCFTWNIAAHQINTLIPPQQAIQVMFELVPVYFYQFIDRRKGFTWNIPVCDI
jgi:hypothetical protein